MKKISILVQLLIISLTCVEARVQLERNNIPLYEIVVLAATSTTSYQNPFQDVQFEANFTSPSGRSFHCYGFYFDKQNWRIRFMPDETGVWLFTWQFGSETGSGNLTCTPKQNDRLHGHVRIDPQNPHKLRYDDGMPIHWIGGKYLSFMRVFGFPDLQPLSVQERLPPETYVMYTLNYLDAIAAKGLNGVVLKISVLPLNYDLKTMNLNYFNYADQIITYAMNLGINVQINIFDSWGKRKENVDWVSESYPPVANLLLEPWNATTYVYETEFYLKYLISRYAAFPNVTWELWNEAQRAGVSAASASSLYVPKIRAYDPYDLPIGASEVYVAPYKSIDMIFFHAGFKCYHYDWNWTHIITHDPTVFSKYRTYVGYGYSNGKPIIWNELYPYEGFTSEQLAAWFRACYWGNLTAGAAGTSEAVWSDIRQVPDLSTTYHGYFANFVNQLVDINNLAPADADVQCSSGTATMCANPPKEYVVYHYTQKNSSLSKLNVYMNPGTYYYQYYNPKTGGWMTTRDLRTFTTTNLKSFSTPTFDQDIVLYIVEKNFVERNVPVELASFTAKVDQGGILLQWQTISETNNYGFEVQHKSATEDFITLQFSPGFGTTLEKHDYRFADYPEKNGYYIYRLKQIDLDGTVVYSPTIEIYFSKPPASPDLHAFPNPTRSGTTLSYQLQQETDVEITIYNILNQVVLQKSITKQQAGLHTFHWKATTESGQSLAAGLYFCLITAKQGMLTNKPLRTKVLLIH